jgi:hypothetical protein
MSYIIKINGQPVKHTYGFNVLYRLDEQLDSASFIIPFDSNPNPIPTYSEVEINDGVKISNWLIASDIVEPSSLNPAQFSHTIELIEYTKKLEYYFIEAAAFTQPTDGSILYNIFNVLDRLRRIVNIELQNTVVQLPFQIPVEVENILSNFRSPELFFNNTTLLEAMKQVLMYIGVLPRLIKDGNNDVLQLDFIAEEKDLVNLEELWIGRTSTQDGSFYATTLVSEADNLISTDLKDGAVYYPDEFGWAALSSPDGVGIVNNDRSVMNVQQSIYELKELRVFAQVIHSGNLLSTLDVDISEYVVTKEQYNLLPVTWNYPADVLTQQTAIYYEQNSPIIEGLTTNWETLFSFIELNFTRRSLENILLIKLRETNNLAFALTIRDDFYRCLFRAKFIPIQEDRHLEIERNNVDVVNKISKMFFRQNDRVISLDGYSSRMKKIIDRVGEPSFILSLLHKNPSEILNVGDYTADDFRLTSAEIQYELDYVQANYEFVKHFPNINKFIGIDRGLQPFEIPTGFKVLNRPIIYRDYLTISTTPLNTNNSLVVSAGVEQILRTFDNIYNPIEAQTGLVINPIMGLGNLRVYAPTIINGLENAFIFNFGFQDNQIAGFRLELINPNDVSKGVIQTAVPYAPNGFMGSAAFEIKAKRTNTLPANFQEAQLEASTLPYVVWHTDEPTYITALSANPMVVLKDPAEILNFNYQLNVFGATNQFVIGKYFTRFNKLIYDLDEPLFYYPSTSTYNAYDNELAASPIAPTVLDTTIMSTLPYGITINNTTGPVINSYAIATASGELLLAVNRVNGVLPTTLYFNFSHVRPGTEIL